jgi:hypothetical protein
MENICEDKKAQKVISSTRTWNVVNAHGSLYALQTASPLAADSNIEFRAFLGRFSGLITIS